MSDIEFVVKKSKMLENRLRQELKAEGKGLGDLTNSVKRKLPSETFQQLHQVNDLRNTIVHEEGLNSLANKPEFAKLCKNIEKSLNKLKRTNRLSEKEGGIWL